MKTRIAMLTLFLAIVASGCDEDERVAKVATEAADRQAKQNEEMARVTKDVTEGVKNLVTADATARKEITAAHRDLQAERKQLNERIDEIEVERKNIAALRRTESILLPVVTGSTLLVAGILVIGFCWSLIFGLRIKDDADIVLNELLITELASQPDFPLLEATSQNEDVPKLPM